MRKKLLLTTCIMSMFMGVSSYIETTNAQVVYVNGSNSSENYNNGGITINNRNQQQSEIGVDNVPTASISVSNNISRNPNIGDGGAVPLQKKGILPAEEFGRDMPFELAVSSIVPGGYHVNMNGVDTSKKVSWSGGRHWKDVLWTMAEANGYNVKYGNNNTITISGDYSGSNSMMNQQTPSATVTPIQQQDMNRTQNSTSFNAQAYASVSKNNNVVTPGDSPIGVTKQAIPSTKYTAKNDGNMLVPNQKERNIVNSPKVTYAPQGGGSGIYYAAQGAQLDQVLQIWSNANGWRVQYDAKMFYPIEMPVTLDGGYEQSVKTLMRAMQENTNPKPKYKFYLGNKVLRIYNYDDGS